MKFTKIPADTFQQIQLNAGILVDDFSPADMSIGNILGATTGGINFTATPTFSDYGEDIDNCPKNTKELKKLDSIEAAMSGTFATVSASLAKTLAGAADVDVIDSRHIIPRNDVLQSDFEDIWWVGDYSDVNNGENAGFCAIHLMNALSTGGFQIQSTDKGKGQFAFTFTGHYSMDAQDVVPYEIYIKQSGEEVEPAVLINKHSATVVEDETVTLTARTTPAGETVAWSTSNGEIASVSGGVVTGEAAGTAIITATITVDGVSYTDTCTIIVEAAPEPEPEPEEDNNT